MSDEETEPSDKNVHWPLQPMLVLPWVPRAKDVAVCQSRILHWDVRLARLRHEVGDYFQERTLYDVCDVADEVDYVSTQAIETQIFADAVELGFTSSEKLDEARQDYDYDDDYYAPLERSIMERMHGIGDSDFNHRRNTPLLTWLERGCAGMEAPAQTIADYFATTAFNLMCLTSCCFLALYESSEYVKNAPKWIQHEGKLLATYDIESEAKAAAHIADGFAALAAARRLENIHRSQLHDQSEYQKRLQRSANARHAAAQKHQVAKRDYQRLYQHYAAHRDQYTSYADASVRIDQKALRLEAEGGTYSVKKVAEMLGKLDKEMRANQKA